MGQLSKLRIVDPVLTTIARGYTNDLYIGNSLFPEAKVQLSGGKIPTWGKENFKRWQTSRALRADSNEMDGGWLETVPYACIEHDIQQRVDYQEIKEANIVNIESRMTRVVADQILLGVEMGQADIAQAEATYPTNNKVTLTDDFFNEAAIDWIEYLHEKKSALASIIAKDPNTMVLPRKVWDFLKFHPKLKSYITVNQDMYQAVATLAKLQEILEIENIKIGGARYSADGEVFDFIWGNNIVLAYVAPPTGLERIPEEPCFGYTLRQEGYSYADKYETNGGKLTFIRSTDKYCIKCVGAESGMLIKNVIDPSVWSA